MKKRRSRSFVALAAALALQAGAGLAAALAPPAAATATAGAHAEAHAGPTWTLETTPTPGTGSQLDAIRCSTATACIAVGFESTGGTKQALAEQWNGTVWTALPLPLPSGARASQLLGLSCPSATDCTAVGWWENGSVVQLTLAEAWNGHSWSIETTQNVVHAKLGDLTAVSCPTTTSCHAVGFYQTTGNAMTFAEIWNGHTWTGQTTPNPAGAKLAQLHAISCAGASSCEAVGNYTDSANVEVTLAESWNGSTWSLQGTPALPGAAASAFGGVSCTAGAACTAVGDEVKSTEVPLAEAWNGKSWSLQTTPDPTSSLAAVLTAVSCPGGGSCTAVGWYVDTAKVTLTLAMGWNGSTWTPEATASSSGAQESYLAGVACAAAAFCSAVGNQTTVAKGHQSLAEQWVGARATTETTVTSSADPAVTGQPMAFTATVTPTTSGAGNVAGDVTFTSAGAGLSCGGKGDVVAVSNGKASCTIAAGFSTSANHTVDAAYGGSGLLVGSTGSIVQTVARDTTTTAVSSSVNPAVTGQSVTYSVVVRANAPGAGTATGAATFTIGGAPARCNGGGSDGVPLTAGRATCTVVGPVASSTAYAVKAAYSGDADYVSSAASLAQAVHEGATGTAVASSNEPSVTGQAVTFTATVSPVAPASGTPTGSVSFSVTGAGQTAVTCRGGNTVTLAGGTATCTVPGLLPPAAPYTVSASYGGDGGFTGSSHSISQQVGAGGTTSALASNANPSVAGQAVTFTATVSPVAPATGTPTGSVTFAVGSGGSAVACRGGNTVPVTAGVARCVVPGLSPTVATYGVAATYGGDSGFSGSAQKLTQHVGTGNASVGLASSADPTVSGQQVTFTARVAAVAPATGTPTGTVTFAVTGAAGAVACAGGSTVTLSGGAATCTITGVAAQSTYSVHATYAGDANFSGAAAQPITQTVNAGATTTALRSSANPSVTGQSVTFTASVAVANPASGTPTGSVTFSVTGAGGAALACTGGSTVALSGTAAVCAVTGMLASQSAYSVHATYNGDANFGASTAAPLSQTVTIGATATSLTSSANPAVTGQAMTFTATVSGNTIPTGSVTFTAGGAPLDCGGSGSGAVALAGGRASCQVAGTTPTSFTVVATYGGDGNYAGSTSTGLVQTVDQDGVVVTIVSSAEPSVYGQLFGLTARVAAAAPGAGTPTGTVTFFVDGKQICDDGTDTFTLKGGQATCPIQTFLAAGSYSVVATYSGDTNFLAGSNSASPFTQTVRADPTATAETTSSNQTRAGVSVLYTAVVGGTAPGALSPPAGDSVAFTATDQSTGAVVTLNCGATGSDTVPIQFVQGPNQNEALCNAPIGTAGTYTVTATYESDGNFLASSGTLTETVLPPG